MNEFRRLLTFTLAGVVCLPGANFAYAQEAIQIEETGVVRTYSASKTIVCGDYEWRVTWSSRSESPRISGDIVVLVNGRGYFLNDAQNEIFGQLNSVNGVSATCNPGSDDAPTRTRLLISGNTIEEGVAALAQVSVEPDGEASWSFDID